MAIKHERVISPGGRRRYFGWRASLGDLSVARTTKAQSTEAILQMAEEALSGQYEPSVITYGTHYALVYRTSGGWAYRLGPLEDMTLNGRGVIVTSSTYGREDVIQSARLHLAQIGFERGMNGLAVLVGDRSATLQHLHWLGFQRAYQHAMTLTGFSEEAMHRYACDHADKDRWLLPRELEVKRGETATSPDAP